MSAKTLTTSTGAPLKASSLLHHCLVRQLLPCWSQSPPEGGENSEAHYRLPGPLRERHLPHCCRLGDVTGAYRHVLPDSQTVFTPRPSGFSTSNTNPIDHIDHMNTSCTQYSVYITLNLTLDTLLHWIHYLHTFDLFCFVYIVLLLVCSIFLWCILLPILPYFVFFFYCHIPLYT